MGKRLIAVTKSPTQPAKAMGPTRTSWPSGTGPKVSWVSHLKTNGSPNSNDFRSGTPTRDRPNCIPSTQKISVGTSPANGPVIPMSNRALRSFTRESITITAPRVPRGVNGMGRK